MKEQIKQFIEEFLSGYRLRDMSNVADFADKFFTCDAVYYGVSSTEHRVGRDEIISLITYDWSYWGMLELDTDNAHIDICGNSAGIVTTGCVKWSIPSEAFLGKVKMDIKAILDSPCSLKECTMQVNSLTSKALLETERGELHVLPVRVSAMLRYDNVWKICQLVISHPTISYPDSRI